MIGRRISGREGVGADLVTTVFAHALDADRQLQAETRARMPTLGIKSFIRRHLGGPELTPARRGFPRAAEFAGTGAGSGLPGSSGPVGASDRVYV